MSKLRSNFPFFSQENPLIYLDNAATTHKPEHMITAMSDFYRTGYSTVNRAVYRSSISTTQKVFETREKIAAFIGASSPENIVFTKGATEALNMIAFSFAEGQLKEGDEICIVETEHHANIVPWQQVAAKTGAKIVVIPVTNEGKLDFTAFKERLSKKTKLVCVAHLSNVTGVIHPIQEMAVLAHSVGAYIVVDAAQSIAHLPIDVEQLGVDFLVFSSHKMYGPTGVGVLYGTKEVLEKMVPYQSGGDMIEKVAFEKTTFRKPPYSLEAGTPMIAEIIGLSATLDFLNEIGMENLFSQEQQLFTYLKTSLLEIPGIRFIGSPETALISFVIEGMHHLDIGSFLDSRGIAVRTGHLCAQPTMERFGVSGVVRVSLGVYNKKEEIDQFISALKACIQVLC